MLLLLLLPLFPAWQRALPDALLVLKADEWGRKGLTCAGAHAARLLQPEAEPRALLSAMPPDPKTILSGPYN